jgi:signal transduction histidine kinase
MILHLAQGVVVNLFVLLGFAALCAMVGAHAAKLGRTIPAWTNGLLFGFMAVVTMLVPVRTAPGVIFDCRSGVIGTAALMGGPLAALMSLPLPCGYRLLLGGSGTLPGMCELILPAIFGSLLHLRLRRYQESLHLGQIVAASLCVTIATNATILALITFCMSNHAIEVGPAAALLLTTNTVASMSLLSALITLERQHFLAVAKIADSERRMLHSQKMAALGQLAGKVAHDFLNALTAILGNAQMAKDQTAGTPRVVALMDDIIATVARIAHFSGELMAFSMPSPPRTQRLALSTCFVGIEQILARTLGAEISVAFQADPAAGIVEMDPELLQQAIVHLAVNAGEAMSGRGRLIIAVAPANLSAVESERLQAGVRAENRHRGPFALLSVQDTGCGMTPDTVSRIFEPFFTTKKNRRNAGLGLCTVYNIVQQHGGHLDVQSEPGHGATFLIYLPVVA